MRGRLIAFSGAACCMLAAAAFGTRGAVIATTLLGIACWLALACAMLQEANLPPGPFGAEDFPDRERCPSTALTDALRRREAIMLARYRRDCKRLGQRTVRAGVQVAPDHGGQA